jgi:hypothetical protein
MKRPFPKVISDLGSLHKAAAYFNGRPKDKEQWAFRGQDVELFPESSLKRHCNDTNLKGRQIPILEAMLIRDFARRFHLYSGSQPPVEGEILEWLSLIRHYGGPTRLIDFSYSLYNSVFFALENEKANSRALWAVNVTQLNEACEKRFAKWGIQQKKYDLSKTRGKDFREVFMPEKGPKRLFACQVIPFRLNERISVQQGLFLAPGDVSQSFMANLNKVKRNLLHKITIKAECRKELLVELHRMGINGASLYPGLEGFARSLATRSLILRDLPSQGRDLLAGV